MDRVSVSQPVEMYSRIGFAAGFAAVAAADAGCCARTRFPMPGDSSKITHTKKKLNLFLGFNMLASRIPHRCFRLRPNHRPFKFLSQLFHPITVRNDRNVTVLYIVSSECYTCAMFALRTLRKRKSVFCLAPLVLCLSLIHFPSFSETPRVAVVDLDGHPADPFRLAGSKIVVLLFIRTDCPIANRYAPTIQDLSAHYANNAAFFLIYPIKSETPDQIRHHLLDYGYHLPAFRDPDLTLARFSQVAITPEVAVFSPVKKLLYHGRIDDWYVEFARARRAPTTHELADSLDATISGKSPSISSTPAVGCFIPGLT